MPKKLMPSMLVPLFTLICHQTASAYYNPGVQRWINRDPIGDAGCEVLRDRNKTQALTFRTPFRSGGSHLYGFVWNEPLGHSDPFGLAERGPETIACQQATEQAEAAWKMVEAEPGNRELEETAILLSFVAAYWCTPPTPPEPLPEQPVPAPIGPSPTCQVVKKTCFWATVGVVTYWVCSEGSRILFPPRNLIPVP